MSSTADSRFFLLVGVVFIAVALAGFGPSFVVPLAQGETGFRFAVYFHALVMFGWLGIYLTQSALPALGKVRTHKRLGYAAIVLFVLLWLSTISISVSSFAGPLPEPVRTLISNIFFLQIISWFIAPALFVLAIRARKKSTPDHKRYMLLLTFFLLEAAASRMRWLPGMSNEHYWVVFQYLYLDLFLVVLVLFDLRTRHGLAHATKVGLGILLPYQVIAVLVWDSGWWLNVADRLLVMLA